MNFNIKSPYELQETIAQGAKKKRLYLNMTQKELAIRSGVSLGSIKKFEMKGQISLSSLLKIALVLNELSEFANIFLSKDWGKDKTLDEVLTQKTRQRARS